MRKIEAGTYDILFGSAEMGISETLQNRTYSGIAILVDENTQDHCLPSIVDRFSGAQIISVQSGEENKNLSTCKSIWRQMAASGLDRHSLMINLGGGVIGDMGGFAASCFMRGIQFMQIPTTLLSQVDASIGGKLGVDFDGLKNFVGLFKDPLTVIVDISFLDTLSLRQKRSGFAEMIKHALIADKEAWNDITKKHWSNSFSEKDILRSINIKREVVLSDPYEKGLRKVLNFGHTIGHAVESLSLETSEPLLHGEAIAIGMIAETILSKNLGLVDAESCEEMSSYVSSVYDNIDISFLTQSVRVLEIMSADKKNKGGEISLSLLDEIGHCLFDCKASHEQIEASLSETYQFLS